MAQFSKRPVRFAASLTVVLCASGVSATVCNVPSGPYPTIQDAVDDPSCSEIVLAAGVFRESFTVPRDLTVRGASSGATVVEGQLVIRGGSTEASVQTLTVDASVPGVAGGHAEALSVEGGAEVHCLEILVRNGVFDPFAIFSDDFESGDTSEWSAAIP